MVLFNIGFSFSADPQIAAREALDSLLARCKSPSLILIFCSKEKFDDKLLTLAKSTHDILKETGCEWIGCANSNADGFIALALSNEFVSHAIKLSFPVVSAELAGSYAVQRALREPQIANALESYLTEAALQKLPKLALQPYLALIFCPEGYDHASLMIGIRSQLPDRTPILKFKGEIFSNGLFLNKPVIVLKAFKKPGQWQIHYFEQLGFLQTD